MTTGPTTTRADDTKTDDKPQKQSDADGEFRRQTSQFRSSVSRDPGSPFPAEAGRYVLYINYGCPWAHRANLVRSLKGLEDVIELAVMGIDLTKIGWIFDGENGSAAQDPLYGFKEIRQLYWKADPEYKLRYTVPVLWDRKKETIVSNESSEIIRMLYAEFDDLLPPERREVNRPGGGLFPQTLQKEIDDMNAWVYDTVNNGVYKTGFASTQEAYEAHVVPLFQSLDRLEEHLGQPGHAPFLFGEHVTDADVRLYTTLIRFDVAYYSIFKCNLKMVRYDYPRLHTWLRRLYWDTSAETNGGAFRKTTYFDCYKKAYAKGVGMTVIPVGPVPDVLPLEA